MHLFTSIIWIGLEVRKWEKNKKYCKIKGIYENKNSDNFLRAEEMLGDN